MWWRVTLHSLVVFGIGLYFFAGEGMHSMLLGLGMMIYAGVTHAIDLLALLVHETVEVELKEKIAALEGTLENMERSSN